MNSNRIPRWLFPLAALSLFTSFLCPPVPSADESDALLRITLTFGKGREVRIVARGEPIAASAEISLDAIGPVTGSWEVAGPMKPMDGKVFFKNIGDFRDAIPGRSLLISSPSLPTAETGSYAVRFVVTSSSGKKKEKIIKYFVGEKPSRDLLEGKTEVPEVLPSESPPPEEQVTGETVLSWDVVPGSLAYQVEIFDKTGEEAGIVANPRVNACIMRLASSLNRPPLVGLMVPAYKTETTVSEIAGDIALGRGNPYLWRVVAMDRDGRELCESPLREFIFSGGP